MAVTAAQVKELRETSGAGMVDCKNALVEANGDMERAIEILREKGMSAAVSKAGRIASEGLCGTYITDDGKVAVAVEVNSETDFVAKNKEFQTYVELVAIQASNTKAEAIEAFFDETWHADTTLTVREALSQKISIIGENLNIRRFAKFDAGENSVFISYIHGGGRVAVLLELESAVNNDAVTEAGKNVCMQIAAMSPKFVSREDVPADFIAKEREILTQQAMNEGKPENIAQKMVEGRLNKELKEMCLVEQEYVKDGDFTIKSYIANVSKEVSADIKIKRFVRFETGEGLEKKDENFADEVNKAMGK